MLVSDMHLLLAICFAYLFLKLYVGKFLRLKPLNVRGKYFDSSSFFLAKEQLEIIEKNDSQVILVDLFPIPISLSNEKRVFESVESKAISFLARDEGIYDELPYKWGGLGSKKNFYDYCNQRFRRPDDINTFTDGLRECLGATIDGLVIEVADKRSNKDFTLGGAMIVSKMQRIESKIADTIPSIYAKDGDCDSERCLVKCHIDEVISYSLLTDQPIFVGKSIYDMASINALMTESADTMIRAPLSTDGTQTIVGPSSSQRPASDRGGRAVWNVLDANEFVVMSESAKREILRFSGVEQLPRPREGAAPLNALLMNLMDEAVRNEYIQLTASSASRSTKTNGGSPAAMVFQERDDGNSPPDIFGLKSSSSSPRTIESSSGRRSDFVGAGSSSRQNLLRRINELLRSKGKDNSNRITTGREGYEYVTEDMIVGRAGAAAAGGGGENGEEGETSSDDQDPEALAAELERLKEELAVKSEILADRTQDYGSYDRYLDQDDWYIRARKKAMQPKDKNNKDT